LPTTGILADVTSVSIKSRVAGRSTWLLVVETAVEPLSSLSSTATGRRGFGDVEADCGLERASIRCKTPRAALFFQADPE